MSDAWTTARGTIQRLEGKNLVGGKLVPASSGETFEVHEPATGKMLGKAAASTSADVDAAVQTARTAQAEWAQLTGRERGRRLLAAAEAVEQQLEEIASITTLETGKAIRTESRGEVKVACDMLRYFSGLGAELKGESVPFSSESLSITLRVPLGVVAAIIPWNVPLLLMQAKIAPALLAGNAVIVKSAEQAPFGSLRFVELMAQQLPPGVVNILSGFGETCGAPLAGHRGIDKVSFTGSVETGRIVYGLAAKNLKPVTLELGGKSPMIVCPDAPLERAIDGALASMRFTRQGQSCTAASRMLVHRSIIDQFREGLVAKLNQLRVGDPTDEATDIGCIVSTEQAERVRRYVDYARAEPGATVTECAQRPEGLNELFVRPVILSGLPSTHRVNMEEIFGPVTALIPWDTEEEVLRMANETEFGLAATVWTNDLRRALFLTKRVQAGFVQVNQNLVLQPALAYGGMKASGLGRECSLEAMLEHFMQVKTIVFNER